LREAVNLQATTSGLFGNLAELSEKFPELEQTSRDLALSLVLSRAKGTFGKYMPLVRNWEAFALRYRYPAYPATGSLFLVYLQNLKAEATVKGTKGSAVPDTVYAVDFAHKLRGLNRPGTEAAVQLLIGATKRALGRPVIKKTAVLKSEVIAMLDFAVPDFDNFDWGSVRAALFAVLAFCLEARFDDLIDLCGDSFFDYGAYIVVFVEHRKMDQFRQGEFVPIYDSGDSRSACALIRAVLAAVGSAGSHLPIFRKVGTGSKKGTYLRTQALSYGRVRELVRELMEAVGMDPDRFGLHSFRSGAASHANAQPNIPNRLKERHGGWAPGSTSAVGYVHETVANALMVPQALSL
jgi:integrase